LLVHAGKLVWSVPVSHHRYNSLMGIAVERGGGALEAPAELHVRPPAFRHGARLRPDPTTCRRVRRSGGRTLNFFLFFNYILNTKKFFYNFFSAFYCFIFLIFFKEILNH
jgi:hypothetical protein